MARSYEHEKDYCARRGRKLTAEMEKAIEAVDRERFVVAFSESARYLLKKQRFDLYRRFLERSMK